MYVLNWFGIASLIEIENINLDPLSKTDNWTYVSFPSGVGLASGSQSCRVSYHSVTFDLWPLASPRHSRRKDQAQEPGKRHNWGPKSEKWKKEESSDWRMRDGLFISHVRVVLFAYMTRSRGRDQMQIIHFHSYLWDWAKMTLRQRNGDIHMGKKWDKDAWLVFVSDSYDRVSVRMFVQGEISRTHINENRSTQCHFASFASQSILATKYRLQVRRKVFLRAAPNETEMLSQNGSRPVWRHTPQRRISIPLWAKIEQHVTADLESLRRNNENKKWRKFYAFNL